MHKYSHRLGERLIHFVALPRDRSRYPTSLRRRLIPADKFRRPPFFYVLSALAVLAMVFTPTVCAQSLPHLGPGHPLESPLPRHSPSPASARPFADDAVQHRGTTSPKPDTTADLIEFMLAVVVNVLGTVIGAFVLWFVASMFSSRPPSGPPSRDFGKRSEPPLSPRPPPASKGRRGFLDVELKPNDRQWPHGNGAR